MSKGWKRYANVRLTAVAGSIGAMLMVWAALFNRDQASQTDASSQALAVVTTQTPAAAADATPTPATTSGATAAPTTTPAPAATRQPARAQIVQPQTRTRGS